MGAASSSGYISRFYFLSGIGTQETGMALTSLDGFIVGFIAGIMFAYILIFN